MSEAEERNQSDLYQTPSSSSSTPVVAAVPADGSNSTTAASATPKHSNESNASQAEISQNPHLSEVESLSKAQLGPREMLNVLLENGNPKLSVEEKEALASMLTEQDASKDKVAKLKSLLGRSAKAQREAKVELEATQKRLENSLKEIDRLQKKIDKLANRPTHMELLADFEKNFDRALLSVSQTTQQQQAVGEDTGPANSAITEKESAVMDTLLMQELSAYKQRVEKLEGLNSSLTQRTQSLENEIHERRREQAELSNKVARLELEKRMAEMEAQHATKAMEEKAASLAEMQMEIDLVTKASLNANARAAQGEELRKAVKTDKQHVHQLEAQVQALQEWASAAAQAKTLAQERIILLEVQLRSLQNQQVERRVSSDNEKILTSQKGSLIVGAGDVGFRVVRLEKESIRNLRMSDRVVLRWKFDLNTPDLTVEFSIAKGICESKSELRNSKYLFKDRVITGGAGGDTEHVFGVDNACTLVWSNVKSWIRPKTVKYTVDIVVLSD